MLEYIRREANRTETENGGAAYATSGSDCLYSTMFPALQ